MAAALELCSSPPDDDGGGGPGESGEADADADADVDAPRGSRTTLAAVRAGPGGVGRAREVATPVRRSARTAAAARDGGGDAAAPHDGGLRLAPEERAALEAAGWRYAPAGRSQPPRASSDAGSSDPEDGGDRDEAAEPGVAVAVAPRRSARLGGGGGGR